MKSLIVPIAWLLFTGAAAAQAPHISNLRQLTRGGQNAEAYWSPDGQRLVFQSTRPPYGCDQIFVMNADGSGAPRLVSTGKGRTTCAYFLGDGKRILYASTHEGGDACPPNPDRSKGYVWGVFATFDIYLADLEGKILKKLTSAPGYDAEATVCWKTGDIVYTSMASGDLDVWTMKGDGSRKKQITRKTGYDGGAVFSRDGRNLVWRSNYPATPETMTRYRELLANYTVAPMKMEIMVGDAGGRHARQVTSFGCASFAPTFTPDGRKILFASNKNHCDSRNFDLFLMNLDGSGLEQVTDSGGFTSFPEISPDGRRIVFCSDRGATEHYEFNVFVGDWK